jgi:4-amino-4-deoxy-L-arabinose transferase-like glycosyltransferase
MSESGARAALGRVPRAAWLCALVALLNAVAWALIVPLFQTPDETAHVAYAQYLAETGEPPSGSSDQGSASQEENRLLRALAFKQLEFRPDNRPLTTAADRRRIQSAADEERDRTGLGGYNYATNNPPLYYALAGLAYRASPSQNLADRIHLMRLLSALLSAITVLLVFGFLRVLLPGTPWAWPVGAVAVALLPTFNNLSGGVNNDNLLFLGAAGTFFVLALCFRDGLDERRGLALGAFAAIGFLAKINMAGLLPGVALAVLFLVLRTPPDERRPALRGALAAGLALAVPVLLYMLVNATVWDRGLLRGAPQVQGTVPLGPGVEIPAANPIDGLSYAWQFYLPRLPFMDDQLGGYPLADVWFEGFFGRFGLLEYGWHGWVFVLILAVSLTLLGLAGRELWRNRELVMGPRLEELIVYAAMAVGLLAVIHWAGYTSRLENAGGFEQARYLFPLLPLYAALIALAARGAGRRWGPAAGVLIVSIAVAHSLTALALTLTRYYG